MPEDQASLADGLFPRDTARSLPIALLKAREAVMGGFRSVLNAHGITEQQWRVIRILEERGAIDASELAERAFILAPSLTRIIKALEERRLILNDRDKGDGRRKLLAIAPAGRMLIEQVAPESGDVYRAIEDEFGKEKLSQLLDLLDELARSGSRTS